MPEVSARPVFGRSQASHGHPTGTVQRRWLHGRAPEQERAGRKGLPRLFPLVFWVFFFFCSDIHLGSPGRNSSGWKAYNKAFTLPEQIQPQPHARGKALLRAGL